MSEHKILTPREKLKSELQIILWHLENEVTDHQYDHNNCNACAIGHIVAAGKYNDFHHAIYELETLYRPRIVDTLFNQRRKDPSRQRQITLMKRVIRAL